MATAFNHKDTGHLVVDASKIQFEIMSQNLDPQDIELIAQRVVEILGERLAKPDPPPPAPEPPPPRAESPPGKTSERLAYSLKELSALLGVSPISVYRLEARGLLKSLPYLRRKIYPRKEVERFLAEAQGGTSSWLGVNRRRSRA